MTGKRRKSEKIREICGTKIINEKNLRHLRNLRDKNNRSSFRTQAIGQRPNSARIRA
jgi:hypothetical protein